jgi:DNA-binding CsgD family transcriptional regulator
VETPATLHSASLTSSLGLNAHRTTGAVVGRRLQLDGVERELAVASERLACIALEGEPGIGKTRLLLAIEELARSRGFAVAGATADEEIRGPFLVARNLFAAPTTLEFAERTGTTAEVRAALDALSNLDTSGLESLGSDARVLRIFDLAAIAVRALASRQPIALLVDDLQWADQDSLRLFRYVVRINLQSRIFVALAMRREEAATVEAAGRLMVDMERMGVLRRTGLERFTQAESTELLQQLLGGSIQLASAAVMHAQAEGVPFVLAEQLRAYREAGIIQLVDGVWTLSRNAEKMLPSAVRTLIQRREARLPDDTKLCLSESAILGRNFSLRDLREIRRRLGNDTPEHRLAELLEPAVAAGLIRQHADHSAADYGFTHEQVRAFAVGRLSTPQRRAVHTAIVDMLMARGDPPAASLPLIARHAIAAGQTELGAKMSVRAAHSALAAHAPDEALRLVQIAHPVAAEPTTRVELLRLRDTALDMSRRPQERLEGLAELSALADALGDPRVELDVMLRRASALRKTRDTESATEIAKRVRTLAGQRGERDLELAACLELGQNLLCAELGEAYTQSATEADLDGAEEAFLRAVELAKEVGDDRSLAAASRELGTITLSRLRDWFVARLGSPEHLDMLQRIAAGESSHSLIMTLPIGPMAEAANEYLRQALEIYERLGDRPGAMNTIIAMAVANWAPEIHLSGSAKRIEEIHRLMGRLKSFTNESQRALAEAQMLFGSLVYARAKVFPDVAITKGEEAYAAVRAIGERSLEFSVAGGLALTHAELDDPDRAKHWLSLAAQVALESPSPWRTRQLEVLRGMVCAAAGDAAGMRRHLEEAARAAADQGRPAHRCEILARLALEAARLGARDSDEELLGVAGKAAVEVRALLAVLPGHPPWAAQAEAALAICADARSKSAVALAHARSALQELDAARREDSSLDVLLPAAAILLAIGSPEEKQQVQWRLQLTLRFLTQHIMDPVVRARWFCAPTGRRLVELAGPLAPSADVAKTGSQQLSEQETRLLQLLVEGRTNAEIARVTGATPEVVSRQLSELYVRIGASSRADATANAFIRRMV